MSASSTHDQPTDRIAGAIAAVYNAAEIEPNFAMPRIVSLDRLIAAHSLRRDEIPNLTRRRALIAIAAMSGQPISIPEDADVALAGFLYAWPYRNAVWGCLLVEQHDIIERRRFSAAHELGHYMLHFRPAIQTEREHGRRLTMAEGLSYHDQTDDTETPLPLGASSCARDMDPQYVTPRDDAVRMEDEANQFAAELLMPEAACRALAQRYGRRASPRRLATEFLVSVAAMHWRLKQLGLAS